MPRCEILSTRSGSQSCEMWGISTTKNAKSFLGKVEVQSLTKTFSPLSLGACIELGHPVPAIQGMKRFTVSLLHLLFRSSTKQAPECSRLPQNTNLNTRTCLLHGEAQKLNKSLEDYSTWTRILEICYGSVRRRILTKVESCALRYLNLRSETDWLQSDGHFQRTGPRACDFAQNGRKIRTDIGIALKGDISCWHFPNLSTKKAKSNIISWIIWYQASKRHLGVNHTLSRLWLKQIKRQAEWQMAKEMAKVRKNYRCSSRFMRFTSTQSRRAAACRSRLPRSARFLLGCRLELPPDEDLKTNLYETKKERSKKGQRR